MVHTIWIKKVVESNKLLEQYLTIMILTITRFTERKALGLTHGPMIMQNGIWCVEVIQFHEVIYDDRVSPKRWFPMCRDRAFNYYYKMWVDFMHGNLESSSMFTYFTNIPTETLSHCNLPVLQCT